MLDLIDTNTNSLISVQDMEDCYGIKKYVHVLSVMSRIPKDWLVMLKQQDCSQIDIEKSQMRLKISNMEKCYFVKRYIYTEVDNTGQCDKWCVQLGIDISKSEWMLYYKMIFGSMSTKLQWFQYQIINRRLICNDKLYLFKIQDGAYCDKCNTQIENIPHLFYDCVIIGKFWNALKRYLHYTCKLSLLIDRKKILFGYTGKWFNFIFNRIIIIAKYNIYYSRYIGRQPTVLNTMEKIFENYNIEFLYSKQNNIVNKFFSKQHRLKMY